MSANSHWWKTDGVLGTLFPTKKALEDEIRRLVAKWQHKGPITGEDAAFLLDVLRRHYQFDEKCGEGLSAIMVIHNKTPYGSSTGLGLVRADGSIVDISWRVPLSPPTHQQNVSIAARYEILDQRQEASDAVAAGDACPVCGLPLEHVDRHVDHKPPHTFFSLFEAFVELECGTTYDLIALREDGIAGMRFVDEELAEQWRAFHRRLATLRVIHKNENLRGVL